MSDATYTLRDRIEELLDTVTIAWPATVAPVATMRLFGHLATLAYRNGRYRLARRLAWHAYNVADHGLANDWAFAGLLPKLMPWAYPDKSRLSWFCP